MNARYRPFAIGWLVLLLLLAVEFGGSFLPLPRGWRSLLMVPAVLMVALVGLRFMRIGSGPTLPRAFAVAGLFWLLILLGLGSMDPLTRTDYTVPAMPAR